MVTQTFMLSNCLFNDTVFNQLGWRFRRFEERFRKFKFRFRDGVGADGRP